MIRNTVLICVLFIVLILIVKFDGHTPSHSAIPASPTAASEETPLRLLKFYVFQIGGNGSGDLSLFENTSDKPIVAFTGHLTVYDKLDQVVDKVKMEYQEPIAAHGKLYLHRVFIDGVLNEKRGDTTPYYLESMAREIGVTSDKLEVTQRYEFTFDKVVQ